MSGKLIEFCKRSCIHEFGDPFTRGHLSFGMLLFDRPLGTCVDCLSQSVAKVLDFSRCCMQITAHTPTVLGVSPIGVPLDSKKINDLVKARYWRVHVVDSTGSTQVDLAKRVRDRQAKSGDVLVTEFQSAGRGRLDRTFVTLPQTSLLFSFYVEPNNCDDRWGWIPLLVGQSVCKAISESFDVGNRIKMKWPNDVLINEKKLAGLLVERLETDDGAGVIIGIGLNVSASREELPIEGATSLEIEGFHNVDREKFLAAILKCFEGYLKRWELNDPTLLTEYCASNATIGRKVAIELPGGEKLIAIASSIAVTGALVLDNGKHITVGDIIHIVSD